MSGADLPILLLCLAAGMMLGGAYLGGLWWTVRRLPRASRPGLLAVASLLARMAILLPALWLVADGQWQRLASALAGFLVMRAVLVRWLGPAGEAGRVA